MDVDTALTAAAEAKAAVAECKARCMERYEDAVADAYRSGASLRQLAEALGLTNEGARQVLRRRGVELRPPHVH